MDWHGSAACQQRGQNNQTETLHHRNSVTERQFRVQLLSACNSLDTKWLCAAAPRRELVRRLAPLTRVVRVPADQLL